MCASALLRVWYPNDKTNEIVEIFVKKPAAYPSYIKVLGDAPYTIPTKDGIKSYTIFEFPNEKIAEASGEIVKYVDQYNSIPGFRYSLQLVMGVTDSLKLRGVKPPTRKT